MGGEKDEPRKWVSWSAGRAVRSSYNALEDWLRKQQTNKNQNQTIPKPILEMSELRVIEDSMKLEILKSCVLYIDTSFVVRNKTL